MSNLDHKLFFQSILTSIVLKSNVTMLDIVSTRMLGQYGFLAKVRVATGVTHLFVFIIAFCQLDCRFIHACVFIANVTCGDKYLFCLFHHVVAFFVSLIIIHARVQVFSIFEDLGISVDCVATSEVSISLTLDPSKLWSRELIQQVSI